MIRERKKKNFICQVINLQFAHEVTDNAKCIQTKRNDKYRRENKRERERNMEGKNEAHLSEQF